ncbi:MAG: pyridoxamine 5'-phosphate oxidase family protein [Acidimicrobiales bacterium]|jgi:nitroimidazol reductase NimA-like FMN-containing flavoprotein (pyridoxamine 5'-phosphate oxidase superfamily)
MANSGDLGRRVVERRQELGLSLESVAARAGMDPSYLHSVEVNPSPQLSRAALWRLAAALETTVDAIAGGGLQAPPGRTKPSSKPILDHLDADACHGLISPGGVGRVVFVGSGGPVALPVNFQMLDGDVVFRTEPMSELTPSLSEDRVSFEVDHLDEALAEGWSVLLQGRGHVVTDPAELEQVRGLPITPWAAGEREVYVRIAPVEITGRRIRQRTTDSVDSG